VQPFIILQYENSSRHNLLFRDLQDIFEHRFHQTLIATATTTNKIIGGNDVMLGIFMGR